MANLFHIAEVGVLLFVAFSASWLLGYGLRRLTARKPVVSAIPAERLAAVTAPAVPAEAALVKAPVVDPIHSAAPPRAAELPEAVNKALDDLSKFPLAPNLPPISVTEPTAVSVDPAATEAPSAATPGLSAVPQGSPIAAPADVEPPAPVAMVVPAPAPAPVVRAPAEPLQPRTTNPDPAPAPAMPTSRAGVAYAGAMSGRPSTSAPRPPAQPTNVPPPAVAAVATNVRNDMTSPQPSAPAVEIVPAQEPGSSPVAQVPPTAIAAEPAQATPAPAVAVATPLSVPEPPSAPTPEPPPVAAPVEPVAPPAPPPRPVYDEDAAMRAIEGGWSRRASRALPDAPELIDVSAAVAKAQSAVQQVLVQSGIDPAQVSDRARPAGTARPRDNSGDDLKHIVGITPLDEQTLNNLGIYRFEQISAWDPTEILWLENHAFARGRIVGEDWQGKARVLLAGRKTA